MTLIMDCVIPFDIGVTMLISMAFGAFFGLVIGKIWG